MTTTTTPAERSLQTNVELAARVTLISHLEKGLHVPPDVESPAAAREYVEEAFEEAGIDLEAADALAEEAIERTTRWLDGAEEVSDDA